MTPAMKYCSDVVSTTNWHDQYVCHGVFMLGQAGADINQDTDKGIGLERSGGVSMYEANILSS
jgi:hypothetical protein